MTERTVGSPMLRQRSLPTLLREHAELLDHPHRGYDMPFREMAEAMRHAASMLDHFHREAHNRDLGPMVQMPLGLDDAVFHAYRLSCEKSLVVGTNAKIVELHPGDRALIDRILSDAECWEQKCDEKRIATHLANAEAKTNP